MADIQGIFKEAWSAARAGANAAEVEAEKVFSRVEASLDEAVRKTAGRLGFPSHDEVTALSKRLEAVSARLAELERRTDKGAG